MSNNKIDDTMRISLQNIADEEGDWLDAPSDEKILLKTAIFESLFSYVSMVTDERTGGIQLDALDPAAMISAMLRRTELDVLDALLKSYEKRFKSE